jgi:hypothetical protein
VLEPSLPTNGLIVHLSRRDWRQEPAVAILQLEVLPDVTTGRVEVVVGKLVVGAVGGASTDDVRTSTRTVNRVIHGPESSR